MGDDTAKSRFLAIQGARWAGMAIVAIGLLAAYRRLPLPAALGYALVPAGLALAFVLPMVLARRWRTPRG